MNNKNLIFLFSGLGLISIVGAYFVMMESGCSEVIGAQVVEMKQNVFDPETLTIQRCTEVVFENKDSKAHWPASNIHPTHGIYPEFDPQKGIGPGNSWSFVFDKAGNWRFHDHLNPTVTGEIIVNE